jgi:hypothetical protein
MAPLLRSQSRSLGAEIGITMGQIRGSRGYPRSVPLDPATSSLPVVVLPLPHR